MVLFKPAELKIYSKNWTKGKECDHCPHAVNDLPGETDLLPTLIQSDDYFMAELN